MKSRHQELHSNLAAVKTRVRQARETLITGREIDLSELTDEVKRACDLVRAEFGKSSGQKLERAIFAQNLDTIIEELDELMEEVVALHASKSEIVAQEYSETD